MALKRTETLGAISDGLAFIKAACEQRGWLKLFDNHVISQSFFCRFLNAAFNLSLVEMDQIKANFPAIDLGDSTNRIAYQITSERGGDKVQRTLDKFVEHDLDKQYDTLRILIIGDRQSSYKTVTVPTSVQFDCERDIMGIEELVKLLGNLDLQRLQALQAILIEEVQYPGDSRKPAEDDTIKLEGHLTIDTALFDAFGCPGIRFTLVNKGKRPAKVRGAALCVEGGPFLPAFEEAFGGSGSLGGCTPPPGLEKQTLCLPLLPMFQPNSPDGITLHRDDVCRFFVPMVMPSLPPFLSAAAKDVSIRARFFDESELPVLVGDEVQGTLHSLVDAYGKNPGSLRFPSKMEVRVNSIEFPEDSMRGKTNPRPFSFVDAAKTQTQEAGRPPRLGLTLAVVQAGPAYTIGIPMKNISESPVQRVVVHFLAKAGGHAAVQRIPFAPSSEEPLTPGQQREFVFPFECMSTLRNLVATLPVGHYGVLVETELERLALPGELVQGAIAYIDHLSRTPEAGQRDSAD